MDKENTKKQIKQRADELVKEMEKEENEMVIIEEDFREMYRK